MVDIAVFGLNYLSGSGEEVENVNRRADGQTTGDQKSSLALSP